MIIIAGYVIVDDADRDTDIAAYRDLVQRARAFDGCIDFAISADALDPERVNLLEIWRDRAALDAWRKQAKNPKTAGKPREIVVQRYNAEDGGPLF